MLIEINASVNSRCPYCGTPLDILDTSVEHLNYPGVERQMKQYHCACPKDGNKCFVTIVSADTPDGYIMDRHLQVFAQDWEDHTGMAIEIMDTIYNDNFYHDSMRNEDVLWGNRLMFNKVGRDLNQEPHKVTLRVWDKLPTRLLKKRLKISSKGA